jgi:hypothetical protein
MESIDANSKSFAKMSCFAKYAFVTKCLALHCGEEVDADQTFVKAFLGGGSSFDSECIFDRGWIQ